MKKIVSLIALSGFMMFAASAFATTSFTDTASTVIGGGTFKVSKGVTLSATATSSAYSAISGHLNGDKEFGTSSADPKIFTKTKTIGGPITTCDNENFSFGTGWTAN